MPEGAHRPSLSDSPTTQAKPNSEVGFYESLAAWTLAPLDDRVLNLNPTLESTVNHRNPGSGPHEARVTDDDDEGRLADDERSGTSLATSSGRPIEPRMPAPATAYRNHTAFTIPASKIQQPRSTSSHGSTAVQVCD